jgi:two-component system response regulator GlrR
MTVAGLEVGQASDLAGMRQHLSTTQFDVVLLDLELEHEHGFEGLAWILKNSPLTRVFVLTSHGSVEQAVECMRRGASGFFVKGTAPSTIVNELAASLSLDAPVVADDGDNFGIIGQSVAIQATLAMIRRLRDVDTTVLILGESGTGKEVVANAIHRSSPRAKHRFAAINCGAIPEMLLESELFGHRRGSFTDAKTDRKGIFEVCSQGTLLLDEIGDMPQSLQAKFLRVLQERQVTPVGASTAIDVDTRVIAATHRDILQEAKVGRFRADLYYRLSIVVLRIPPLRERLEDIPLLTQHFLDAFNQRFCRSVRVRNNETMARLMAYDWPGNVRELRNALERGVVLASDDELTIDNMFQHLTPTSRALVGDGGLIPDRLLTLPLSEAKEAFEKLYLENLLRLAGGNIANVSERSGRYRADVYRLLHRFGIEPGSFRQPRQQGSYPRSFSEQQVSG